jgi:hypothetical protein
MSDAGIPHQGIYTDSIPEMPDCMVAIWDCRSEGSSCRSVEVDAAYYVGLVAVFVRHREGSPVNTVALHSGQAAV